MIARGTWRETRRVAPALALLAAIAALAAAGRYVYERSAPGAAATVAAGASKPLPVVRFLDASGTLRALADFRGRVVLLNVWATWCVPCRKEMPALDRLQAQLGGPAFEVVALSIDRDPQAVREFYRQYGIRNLALYIDPSSGITGVLGTVGIPTTVLVDREGRERWRRLGPAEWDAPVEVAQIRQVIEGDVRPGGAERADSVTTNRRGD